MSSIYYSSARAGRAPPTYPGILIMAETVTTTRLLKKDSFITGHHVYKTIWTPFLEETWSVETTTSMPR